MTAPLAAQVLETSGDVPARPSALHTGGNPPLAVHSVQRGPFISYQVNVDSNGNNLAGDAGNEPSLAIDPTNPNNLVAGWRQSDSVAPNFRQAGYAYSHDGAPSGANPTSG